MNCEQLDIACQSSIIRRQRTLLSLFPFLIYITIFRQKSFVVVLEAAIESAKQQKSATPQVVRGLPTLS